MSHTPTQQAPPSITRDGISKTLTQTAFANKSKAYKGHKFFTPELSVENFETDSKWVGLSNLVKMANKWLRGTFAELYQYHFDQAQDLAKAGKGDGKINWPAYLEDMQDFTAGQTKLGDLDEEIEALSVQQQELFDQLDVDDKGQFTSQSPEIVLQMQNLNVRMKALRTEREGIKEVYKQRKAAADAKKASQGEAVAA